MFLYGLLWSCMAFYGHITVFHGLSWQNVDLIGLVSSCLAVIDPILFGLVTNDSCMLLLNSFNFVLILTFEHKFLSWKYNREI